MPYDWNGRGYEKSAPSAEARHKEEYQQRGGCGDMNCRICYTNQGEFKGDDDGKYGGVSGGLNEVPPYVIEAMQALSGRDVDYAQQRRQMMNLQYSTTNNEDREALKAAHKAVAKYILSSTHTVQWDDIVGNERARVELREAIEAAHLHKQTYTFYDMKPPKGVMLFGPPGCGKTMFGKATAAALSRIYKSDVELMVINGPELESPVISIAGQRVQEIFTYAALYQKVNKHPLVIFIDEADALLKDRTTSPWAGEIVGAFLAAMDGLKDNGAFVILATNRPDQLDEALLRDGRCERKIKVERPTLEAAHIIAQKAMLPGLDKGFILHTETDFIESLFDPMRLLRRLTNPITNAHHHFTLAHIVNGAMIVGLIGRAKAIAFRRDIAAGTQTGVSRDDFFAAVEEVFEENKALTHSYAIEEFVTEIALPAEEAKRMRESLN